MFSEQEQKGFILSFFRFLQLCVFYHYKTNGQIDFSENQASTTVKHLLPLVCQILWNFTRGNTRKFTVSFLFVLMLTHKILKNTHVFLSAHAYYMSFCPQCTWDHKTIGSHLKSILGTEAI